MVLHEKWYIFNRFNRYKNVMFMVVSDDLKWCRENLEPLDQNIIINEDYGTVFEDMALISLGAHTVISLGSYGLWGATLGSGEVFFPADKISNKPYFMQIYLKRIKNPKIIGVYWQ